MKQYFTTLLTLVCAVLIAALFVIKGGDKAQHEKDASAITDFSNRLDSAQAQLTACNGMMLTLSNRLDELDKNRSAALTFSNQLAEAQSALALAGEHITNLTRQVAEVESENQTLGRHVAALTNQVTSLTSQIALTETNLNQANRNYVLLENRLRRDVAERVVVERKFDNLLALRRQMQYLKQHPVRMVSADDIYAGLGVEVTSNTFHVVSPE